jgi:hypothetical protein
MTYDEPLVGSLAILVAVVSLAIAVGPWTKPYELKSVHEVHRRFGKSAARGVWVLVAAASLASGLAILSGFRPSYAAPAGHAQELR